MTVALAVVAVLLAVIFTAAGSAKIRAIQPMRELAAEAGFSVPAYRRIGVLEVAGALGLLVGLIIAPIGALAGVGLLLLLAGAVVVHLRKKDGPQKLAPAVVCGLLVAAYLVLQVMVAR